MNFLHNCVADAGPADAPYALRDVSHSSTDCLTAPCRFFPGASKHDARQVQRSRNFTDIRIFLKVGTHALQGMASPDLQLAKNAAPPFCCCIPIYMLAVRTNAVPLVPSCHHCMTHAWNIDIALDVYCLACHEARAHCVVSAAAAQSASTVHMQKKSWLRVGALYAARDILIQMRC